MRSHIPRLGTHFDLLAVPEEPRHYERALRFGTATEALSFLESYKPRAIMSCWSVRWNPPAFCGYTGTRTPST